MNITKLKNDTILVVKSYLKNKIIEEVRKNNKLLNIKFMSLDEIRNNYYFTYDEKAIYYLINKYHYKYDVCLKYLNNLKYIDKEDYQEDKLKKLIDIKKELENNNLLKFNSLFKNSLKNKNILIYNYGIISKFDLKLIDELKTICNVEIYNDEENIYEHKYIYEFNDIEEEVVFVASSICKLINEGININNIKICGINDEYNNIIKKIFTFYNIPIVFNDSVLYATKIGQDFLNNLNSDISITFKYIEDNYNLKDENILALYNAISNIINKYVWCDDIVKAKEIIINDFKNKKVNIIKLASVVDVIKSLDIASDDDYVFLMSFNQGIIPKTYKDEDYLNNTLKDLLNIDNTNDLNKNSQFTWLNNIKKCKNLTITYKKHSPMGDFYLSSLNDQLNLETKNIDISYNYSNIYNKIKLTSYIDNLVKYNLENKDLPLLYNNYKDINYMTYDNSYVKINKDKLKKYLNKKLVLSYSAINNYYHCAFKYYLANILKVNIYEETFYTILGNLFHYILSICFDRDIDIKKEYNIFISKQTYKFNARERFFLDNLLQELIFIINTIKKQYEYSTLNYSMYEEKIEIDKSKDEMLIIFKGFVDKIMLDNDKKIAAIIDYKTGNPDLNLNNCVYGLDLQLPVYIYLVKYKFPNIRIVGFYLQKILNSEITKDNKHTYEYLKEDKLKLQGYTNKDENLISIFDSDYMDSKVIKGMRTTSKGIASKKVMDDVTIDKLSQLTEDKINESIDKILNSDFSINPKRIGTDTIGCKYCTFRDICFMSEKDIVNLKEYKNLEFLNEE